MFDWMTTFVEQGSYISVAFLMFAENVFPPIPSELVMPLAGFTAARGETNVVGLVIAGSLGSLLGALFWYGVGYWISPERLRNWAERHGRWMTLKPTDVDYVDRWFDRHGGKAVLVGRLLPAVRTLISVPAGMARMGLRRFLLYSTIGTVIWTGFLTTVGYALGARYELVSAWMSPVSNGIVGLIVIWYLYRVATFRKDVSST